MKKDEASFKPFIVLDGSERVGLHERDANHTKGIAGWWFRSMMDLNGSQNVDMVSKVTMIGYCNPFQFF